MFILDPDQIEHFREEGVVFLPGLFSDWVEPLRQAVELAMRSPSPLERSYQPKDGSALFFKTTSIGSACRVCATSFFSRRRRRWPLP